MTKSYVVVFAGVPGSSKTIIANYLSVKFNLPVFNNDQLRFEVKEDMMAANINAPEVLAEFEKRYKERFEEFLTTGHPMLLDGSIDRRWKETKKQLGAAGYVWYMIDMEMTEPFLKDFFIATGRPKFLDQLPRYLEDHRQFMKQYSSDVSLQITDETFPDRLRLAADGLQAFLDKLEKEPVKG